MKKTVKKTILAMLLVLTMVLQGGVTIAQAASTTSKVPITCYTISTGRVNTYKYSNGKYSYTGYIDGYTDQCVILDIKEDGYCSVRYPVGKNKYRTAYTPSSNFFVNTDFSTNTTTIGSNKTVYRRSNLSQKLGTVYADDEVIVIGTSGNKTQIIYKITNKNEYKMGWVSGKYSADAEQVADISNGYYQIKSAINSDYVLDVYGGYQDDGANVQIYKNQLSINQGFILKKQSDGYYTIAAIHSGKLLDVEKGASYNGVNVLQWTSNGGDNQKWKIVKTSDGYYSFISKCNGLYLDVNGGIASNEVNVQCYTGNSTMAQKFILQSVTVDGEAYPSDNSTSEDKIQALIDFEISQLGIGDVKGNNNVVYNTWYYGKTIKGSGYAWCQAFQSYCADQVGVLDTAIPKTNNCASAVSWYKKNGQFQLAAYYGGNYTPKAGDLVFYGKNGSSHVGLIIASPVNGYLQVVEGNVYDSSTGNYTVQKFTKNSKRTVSSSYVYGYGTPNYN